MMSLCEERRARRKNSRQSLQQQQQQKRLPIMTTLSSSSSSSSRAAAAAAAASSCLRILSSSIRLVVALLFVLSSCQATVLDENFGYKSSTDVSAILALARDIEGMRISKADFAKKMDIYQNGLANGATAVAGGLTLQSLSTAANVSTWAWNPMYNIYVQGFDDLGLDLENDDPGFFDGEPVENYADTLVRDLFLLNVTYIEADAAVALNVGMAYFGALYDVLGACYRAVKANVDPSVTDKVTAMTKAKADMNAAVDRAMALYIGDGQEKGDDDSGFMLYNLAQFVGTKFNQAAAGGGGEVRINEETLGKLFVLQERANDGVTCTSTEGYTPMAEYVKQLVRYLNIVYVQMLLFRTMSYQADVDTDFVELYSLALMPQIESACDSDLYESILALTVQDNVDENSVADASDVIQATYDCLGITCAEVGALEINLVPVCVDESVTPGALAGFVPETNVNPIAYLDRDMTQIRWLMQRKAYQAAAEMYQMGWNSITSLQDLATRGGSQDFAVFNDFYSTTEASGAKDMFVHKMIQDVISGTSPFDQATPEQRTAMVDGLFKGVVMTLSVTQVLEEAISTCQEAANDPSAPPTTWTAVVHRWETAVAYYVGSKEGPEIGGPSDGFVGESLYGLCSQYCSMFGQCSGDDPVPVAGNNLAILEAFESGRDQIVQKKCDSAQTIFDEDIRALLLVPLIQGTLHHFYSASLDPDGVDTGFAYALSRAILPFVNEINPVGAAKIRSNTDFSKGRVFDSTAVADTFAAFENAIPKLGLACKDIGTYRAIDNSIHELCDPSQTDIPEAPPVYEPPTTPPARPVTKEPPVPKQDSAPHVGGLAWGRYTFKYKEEAEAVANFALDVQKMWLASNTTEAGLIYIQGQNVPGGVPGQPSLTSLASLSTQAAAIMPNDILYEFYRYALYADDDFDGFEESGVAYADEIVNMALKPDRGNSIRLGTEAAVIMNVFMMIMHQLYTATRECLKGSTDVALYIDSAVALWIGAAQSEGAYDSGYLMYWVAQEAGRLYGVPEVEHPANAELMTLFNLAQALSEECAIEPSDAPYRAMRIKVDEIIRAMSKPLIQHLLYYIAVGDQNYEELYALSVVPQMSACNIGDYGLLRDTLFEGIIGNGTDQEALLRDMGSGLSCLRMTCTDLGDITKADKAVQDLVLDLCDELESEFDHTFLAKYVTSQDVYEMARLDIDLHRIDMLMRAGAFDAAQEIYMYGQNSFSVDKKELRTWKSLAMGDGLDTDDALTTQFTDYWESLSYPDELVERAMQGSSEYQGATNQQRAEAVKRTIQVMVTYLHITTRILRAVTKCENKENGSLDIDEAAALFTGSLEGTETGGSETNSGVMLMALAKETCEAFGTCESNNDATANEFLMFAFSDIKQWLDSLDCDSAKSIAYDSVLKILPVPVIQGTLMYAELNQDVASEDEGLVTGDILARTMLPQVDDFNVTSASTILSNMAFDRLSGERVPDGPAAIFEAFEYVMIPLNLDCSTIGIFYDGLSVCDESVDAPDPDTPTDLGNSLYTTTTYVKDLAGIALDVKQMADDLEFSNGESAKLTYMNGENSPIYNTLGQRIGQRSLSFFSTNASETMTTNALYKITVHALQDEAGKYLGAPATRYADSIVMESFSTGGKSRLAADAAVALNLWMEIANVVAQAFTQCKHTNVKDNEGIHYIDQVVAYWIGDEEVPLDAEKGHLLYNLAEVMGHTFGTIDPSGQAYTNAIFLKACTQARLELSYPDACSGDMTTLRRLRHVSERLTTQMIIVQIQALINALVQEDRSRVRIYAHGFVPLVSGCNPNAFAYLKDKLLPLNPPYIETEVDEIIEYIYSTLPCFNIKCGDIGEHKSSESGAVCGDRSPLTPLAGYRPESDVLDYAQFDLDILWLDILMAMEAYEAADDLYMYGKHAESDDFRSALSLYLLATDDSRSMVPEFSSFSQYFGSDDYANIIIKETFDTTNKMEPIYRRYTAVGAAQYMVMYMAALQAMHQSIENCGRRDLSAVFWDQAAAYIIGFLEGPVSGGSNEGLLIWGLAKEHCAEFGTCSEVTTGTGASQANDLMLTLLYTGQGALTGSSCEVLKRATSELSIELRVPMLQGALSLTSKTASDRSGRASAKDEKAKDHAMAYILARSILPLIANGKRDESNLIAKNLDFEGNVLEDGTAAVSGAFVRSINTLEVNCEAVGTSKTADACSGSVKTPLSENTGLLAGLVVVSTFALIGIGFLILYMRRRKRQGGKGVDPALASNGSMNGNGHDGPVFVRNDAGEMNHDSAADLGADAANLVDEDIGDEDDAQLPPPV